MKASASRRVVWLLLAAAACVVAVGCEKANDLGGVSVDPPDVVLGGSSNVVYFTASVPSNNATALPLQWSVSDPGLGGFRGVAGVNAVYIRNAPDGINVVTVRTPDGSKGIAVVRQQ